MQEADEQAAKSNYQESNVANETINILCSGSSFVKEFKNLTAHPDIVQSGWFLQPKSIQTLDATQRYVALTEFKGTADIEQRACQ